MTTKCDRFRELIDDYTLDALSHGLRRELEEHLADCTECRHDFEEARALHEALMCQPEPVGDAEWASVETRTLARLRIEMTRPRWRKLVPRLGEFFGPLLRPQPRLVFALASGLIVVLIVLLSVVWVQSSSKQMATDDSWFTRFWTDDDQAPQQDDDKMASLLTGVEQILSAENGESDYETGTDSALEAIAQEADLDELDSDALDDHIYQYSDAWAVNGGYYSDILDASEEEMKSAIQAVFGASENGS